MGIDAKCLVNILSYKIFCRVVKPRFSKEICEPALSLSVKCLHSCDPQMPQKRLQHFFGYFYLGKVLSKKKKEKQSLSPICS